MKVLSTVLRFCILQAQICGLRTGFCPPSFQVSSFYTIGFPGGSRLTKHLPTSGRRLVQFLQLGGFWKKRRYSSTLAEIHGPRRNTSLQSMRSQRLPFSYSGKDHCQQSKCLTSGFQHTNILKYAVRINFNRLHVPRLRYAKVVQNFAPLRILPTVSINCSKNSDRLSKKLHILFMGRQHTFFLLSAFK